MTVLRINKKDRNFLILDKTCLQDKSLSWGAKGLHAYLMSLPDNWSVKVSDLSKRATNGRDAVRGLLNELKAVGYIVTSWARNEKTGKFNSLEYCVHETPQQIVADADVPCPEYPATENPSPANPCPVNPTLISINTNKDPVNRVLTAATKEAKQDTSRFYSVGKAAAAFSHQTKEKPVQFAAPTHHVKLIGDDVLIGETLTANQVASVQSMVEELEHLTEDAEQLAQEVMHCLLSPKHFTACGGDFVRKHNAIRLVIKRGDWQTPSGMVVEKKQELAEQEEVLSSQIKLLKSKIYNAEAEYHHFQKFMNISHGEGRKNLEETVKQIQSKIKALNAELALTTHQPAEQAH